MNSELLKLALSQQQQAEGPAGVLRAPPPQQQQQQRTAGVHESAILKLKGLPYDTTKEQVHDFFHGFDLKTVEFVYEPDGRPSGLAFAEFLTRDEAIRAMAKNGEFIGDRYVKLLLVPRQEMEEQVRLGTIAIPGGAARARAGLLRRRGGRMPMHSALGGVPGMPGTVDMMMNVMQPGAALLSPHPYSQASYSPTLPGRDMYGADNYMYMQHMAQMAPHMAKPMHPQAMPMQPPLMAPQTQHLALQGHMHQPHSGMRHVAMQPQLGPHHAHHHHPHHHPQALHTSQMLPGPIAPPSQLYPQAPSALHPHHHAMQPAGPAPPSPAAAHHHPHHHASPTAAAAAAAQQDGPHHHQPPSAQASYSSSSGGGAGGAAPGSSGAGAGLASAGSGGAPGSGGGGAGGTTAGVKTLKGSMAPSC